MGWKNIKEHFNIEHIVSIEDGLLRIGSRMVSDLGLINLKTGRAFSNSTFDDFLAEKYPQLLEATAEQLLALLEQPDTFEQDLPVYRFDGKQIVEHFCEARGWPNVTHDGFLMYDNEFYPDKATAAREAQDSLLAHLESIDRQIDSLAKDMTKKQQQRQSRQQILKNLRERFPAITEKQSKI